MAAPTVLLSGATGFLGVHLLRALAARGCTVVVAGRPDALTRLPSNLRPLVSDTLELDLAQPDTAADIVRQARPTLILNAAALSSIAACAADPDRAHRINAATPGALATSGTRLLHVSTDQVFDGRSAPYAAADPPSPTTVYGTTKLAGERAAESPHTLIVRLPLLFGPSPDGRRGATDMIRAAPPASPLTLYTNEHRTPLHAAAAATALVDLLLGSDTGTLHLRGPERLSRYDLGLRFARLAGLATDRFRPGECTDPTRPRDTSLTGTIVGPPLDEALAAS